MKIHDVSQKSEEWHALRKQYFLTASNALAIATGGDGLETLIWQSFEETKEFTNGDMERGVELEPQARILYEMGTENTVKEVAFVTDEDICPIAGASPDGLVNGDGLIEIKCPSNKTYYYLLNGKEIDKKYLYQMQMQLLFTGRKWNDFVAFNPNFKQSLIIKRVFPDTEIQQKIIAGLNKGEGIYKEIKTKIT